MTAATHGFRPEIQGLRAIAVLIVLLFHIWPDMLPGGYVGVDVFFVISGYLITGLLLRDAETNGRISIIDFYTRRIKRLLPAATVVLVVVATCISILPLVRWEATAHEIIASALYAENWWLVRNSVDYLAMDAAPSPLQHYWSLSIEEQYYILWPAALALVLRVPRFTSAPKWVFAAMLVFIGVVSLAHSIHITPKNPGIAYFATTTRMWELALGGALATCGRWHGLPGWLRASFGYLGLASIAAAALLFSGKTAFPGYLALIPTVGATLLLMAGRARWSPYAVLKSAPMQYFGDISYSLYLWHWPVVVFYRELTGRPIEILDGMIVAAVSIALAHQSKALIEDPFRKAGFAASRRWMPFAFAGLCIGYSIFCALFVLHQVRLRDVNGDAQAGDRDHPGAMALYSDAKFDPTVPYFPQPLQAYDDQAQAYVDGCIGRLMEATVRRCEYGDNTSRHTMVLVGDSHAVQWIPALDIVARRRGWKLIAITKSSCPVSDVTPDRTLPEQFRLCTQWNRQVIRQLLAKKPEIVVFAQSWGSLSEVRKERAAGVQAVSDGTLSVWNKLQSHGISIVAIRDTPRLALEPSECMGATNASASECGNPRKKALPPALGSMPVADPILIAAQRNKDVLLVDMTNLICGPEQCLPVVGNVMVWRDKHHLTASYVRTLATPLERKVYRFMDRAARE